MLMTPVFAAGRIEFQHGNTSQAVSYLQEGLHIAEQINKAEDEARLRHRLGLALWHTDQLEAAQDQLEAAAALLETIRHRPGAASNEGTVREVYIITEEAPIGPSLSLSHLRHY